MTDVEKRALKHRVSVALGINPDFGPVILATPEGAVRHVLTAFGDPIEGWRTRLKEAGIPLAPDV